MIIGAAISAKTIPLKKMVFTMLKIGSENMSVVPCDVYRFIVLTESCDFNPNETQVAGQYAKNRQGLETE